MPLDNITEGDSVSRIRSILAIHYAMNSFATKEKYLSRLKSFFDYIKLEGNRPLKKDPPSLYARASLTLATLQIK